eukprot:Hpha_TRINITY_DN19900_c0_g1::TRINITY_DN19900_c0_g1_i1::g.93588::m.93588
MRVACRGSGLVLRAVRTSRRGVTGAADPLQGASMFEARSQGMSEDVRGLMDVYRSAQAQKIAPENVGSVIGAEGQQGLGGELDHLEGLEAEARRRNRLNSSIAQMFPPAAAPLPNAMEIATAPTHEELAMQEENDALKEAVRDRYRRSVERREAEKRRRLEAERLAEEALQNSKPVDAQAPAAPAKAAPSVPPPARPPPSAMQFSAGQQSAGGITPRPVVVNAPRELRAGASETERQLHALQTDLAIRAADFESKLGTLRMQAAALEIERVGALVDGKREQLQLIAGELQTLRDTPLDEPEPVEEAPEGEPVSMREKLTRKQLSQERLSFLQKQRSMESELAVARLRIVELELEALGRELAERRAEVKRYSPTTL